jgi:glutamate carboxypeptidase
MPNWKNDKKIQFLRELVEINSGTRNIGGVNAVQDVLVRYGQARGWPTQLLTNPLGSDESGKFLIIEILASQASSGETDRKFVNLVTHADTVFEPESQFLDFTLNEEQGTAIGPGVIDDKGGIVVALEGLARYLAQNRDNNVLNIRLLCSPSEEIGSPGFQKLFTQLSHDAWMVLGFEPSLEDGSIVESRRGNRWYDIQVTGVEAHAGRNHRSGVNAAYELAYKMTQLDQLTDYAKDLTLSVGAISGGSKFNIVCGHAQAKLDVRFSDFHVRDEAHEKIEKIIQHTYIKPSDEGKIPQSAYRIDNDCPPFPKGPQSESYLQAYREIIARVEGQPVMSRLSGGSADSNLMSRPGLVFIDGLGASGGGTHRLDEFILLRSLETRAECLAQFLAHVNTLHSSTRDNAK